MKGLVNYMKRKSLLGIILLSCLIICGMFSIVFLTRQDNKADTGIHESYPSGEDSLQENKTLTENTKSTSIENAGNELTKAPDKRITMEEATAGFATDLAINSSEEASESEKKDAVGEAVTKIPEEAKSTIKPEPTKSQEPEVDDTFTAATDAVSGPQLIFDCNSVDYMSFVPEIHCDSELEMALNIVNPSIDLVAEAAILFDADTKEVLFHKNPTMAEFPASTTKLLTSIVALEWCSLKEEVTVGAEVGMIASDSSIAGLWKGQVLTIRNLLEGMLLPSGNDAAYVVAAYVGRKSLKNEKATKEEAVLEFTRLMNQKAKELGVKNSCFKTPDGYDAIGQYVTAYDMGLIGIAAAENEIILEISQKSSSRNIFVSGDDVTWNNTNRLINKYSGQYYSCAIGLKTGSSTMAGRCLVSAAEKDGQKVVCVILDSTSSGRWEDSIELLKYGLN